MNIKSKSEFIKGGRVFRKVTLLNENLPQHYNESAFYIIYNTNDNGNLICRKIISENKNLPALEKAVAFDLSTIFANCTWTTM